MTAQTSEHGGYIRGLAVEQDTAGEPVSGAATRAIVNNLMHCIDESGQVLASLTALASDDMQGAASTTFALISNLDLVVPVRIRPGDGSTFRVVVYMRALTSAAGTATFRVALRDRAYSRRTPTDPAYYAETFSAQVSSTSTSGADLTATLYLEAAMLRGLLSTVESTDGGGVALSAEWLQLSLQVWAKSSGAGIPRVYQFTAREFAGAR